MSDPAPPGRPPAWSGPPPGRPPVWYGPPAYGPQPGYALPYPPPGSRTNTMAILALVFGLVFAPLGIVFGVIGRRQIRRTGEDGQSLATAGLVLGIVFTALGVVLLAVYVVGVVLFVAHVHDLPGRLLAPSPSDLGA